MEGKKRGSKFYIKIIVVLVVALGAFYGLRAFNAWRINSKNPEYQASQELSTIVKSLSRYMILPNEQPAMATINNKDDQTLRDNPFFVQAENGDKIIIYPTAKKAILYRPSTMMVVDVAPFVLPTPKAVISSPAPITDIKKK